jgi:DEAD/DEAH box helicase domain-containing protein
MYRIRPQVSLGPAEGLERTTRADFLISLAEVREDKQPVWNSSTDEVLPIAVYLDGYTYHARQGNLRVKDDFEIRHSIVQTGRMLTWTLTWGDLDRFEALEPDKRKDALAWTASYKAGKAALQRLPAWSDLQKPFTEAHNSMDRLLFRLKHPDLPRMKMRRALSLLMLQRQFGFPSIVEGEIESWLQPGADVPSSKVDVVQDGRFYIFPDLQWRMSGFADTIVAVRLRDLEIRAAVHLYDMHASIDKSQWEQCWQLYNMVQEEAELTIDAFHKVPMDEEEQGQSIQELLDIYDASVHEVVRKLHAAGIRLDPDGGTSVMHNGEMADAHIVLEAYKIFFMPFDEHARNLLISLGYRECPVDGFDISMLRDS